jgi:hypothetical protein
MPKVWAQNDLELPDGAVYIGRPSKWGNPYTMLGERNRGDVIRRFREYVLSNPLLMAAAQRELRGRDLYCPGNCKPRACHGDVWLEVANAS